MTGGVPLTSAAGIAPSVPSKPADPTPCQPSFLAALVDIGPALPTIAATTTVFAYVGGPTPLADDIQKLPLVAGLVSALVIGLGVAVAYYFAFSAADHAHPQSYAEIRQRVDKLGARLRVLERLHRSTLSVSQAIAFEEAVTHLRTLERELVRGGSQWLSGSGYVDALIRIHRAEEALLTIEPVEDVVAAAYYDEQRIHGSTIGDRDDLLERLRTAVQALSPSGSVYLNELPTTTSLPDGRPDPARDPVAAARVANAAAGITGTATMPLPSAPTPPAPATPASVTNGAAAVTSSAITAAVPAASSDALTSSSATVVAPEHADPSPTTAADADRAVPTTDAAAQQERDDQALPPAARELVAAEARIALREVRHALNDFRDASRAGLVQSRSALIWTISLTGIITYVLLAFAVNLNNKAQGLSDPIAAAGVIYFVGAVVGLFNRLYVESGDDTAIEDYGLTRTRTLLTPMLSGLAAVGGVLLTGMLAGVVDVNLITPAGITGAATTPIARQVTTVGTIFNLQTYPFAVVLAAAFGFTPRMLLERLQNVSDQTTENLKSTQANRSVPSPTGDQSAGKG